MMCFLPTEQNIYFQGDFLLFSSLWLFPSLRADGGVGVGVGWHWAASGAKSPTWDLLLLCVPLLPLRTPCAARPVALGQTRF